MPTYTVGILRQFTAQHFLIGGDWGRENAWHSHPYRVEAMFEGDSLDRHGYLIDISEVIPLLDAVVERYRDKTLNELAEFADLNPSLERFAAAFAQRLAEGLPRTETLTAVIVKLWESDDAFASHRKTLTVTST
jgi:6-pyruvoyltetrahydropterin/6-carboxytetrahydropterin synthase